MSNKFQNYTQYIDLGMYVTNNKKGWQSIVPIQFVTLKFLKGFVGTTFPFLPYRHIVDTSHKRNDIKLTYH